MDELVIKFPRLKEVRGCVVLALNEEYSHLVANAFVNGKSVNLGLCFHWQQA
ncbi:hypothetical protein YC2023_018378 [Brassica napus]